MVALKDYICKKKCHMKIKFIFASVMIVFLMVFTSCHKHEDIDVTIDVISPVANSTISNPASTLFHIVFSGTGELHDIRILVYPKANPGDKIIDFDQHEHARSFTFMETRDLQSYPASSVFVMQIEADKDEEGKETERKVIEFRIP
jgi:hypothetical protein